MLRSSIDDKTIKKLSFRAAEQGDIASVERYVQAGIDVNMHAYGGRTMLHRAVYYGHAAIVKLLLDAGAEVDATDKSVLTPLQSACESPDVHKGERANIVQMLLERGANPNTKCDLQLSPLNRSLMYIHINPSIVKHLINAGADINYFPPSDTPPVFRAIRYSEELFDIFLVAGADVSVIKTEISGDYSNESTITDQFDLANVTILKKLINAGYNINYQDQIHGRTLLMKMMLSNSTSSQMKPAIELLIKTDNVDVTLRDKNNKTAEELSLKHSKTTWACNRWGDPEPDGLSEKDKNKYMYCVKPMLEKIRSDKIQKASLIYREILNPLSYFSTACSDITRIIEGLILQEEVTDVNEKSLLGGDQKQTAKREMISSKPTIIRGVRQ